MQTAPYENIANGLASLGRYEDSYLVHAAEGETVIPAEVFEANPSLREDIFKQMRSIGIKEPERYIVGNELNSINPETGQPEFFFKKIGKLLKKAAPIIGSVIGFTIGGPAGAAIGSGLGSLAGGAKPEEALLNAGLSFMGGKYIGPYADKLISGAPVAGQIGPTALKTLGSSLPSSIGSALPSGIASLGLGTAGALALAPSLTGILTAKPEEQPDFNRRSVVDEYYAAKARGENPPLPPELTPPPQESLMEGRRGELATIEDIRDTSPYRTIAFEGAQRPMFRQAPSVDYEQLIEALRSSGGLRQMAYGGMVKGPGGPTDDKIPTLLSNTEFVQTGKAVAGADPSGKNNPDEGAKVMMGIMRAFEKRADRNAAMA